jgi:hypothetical protein
MKADRHWKEIIKGLGFGLDEAAIKTIESRWRFIPAMLNGQPIDVIADIDVAFDLY